MKRSYFVLPIFLLALPLMVACGSASGVGSCDLKSVGYCEQYVGGAYSQGGGFQTTALKSACTAGGGTWSDGGCPGASATGRCVMAKGAANEIVVTYYTSKFPDKAAAQTACSSGLGGNSAGAGEFQDP